ncbi:MULTISPECIES: helix-turn-helix domain-containing protein [Idiomarinaceae]|uniref:Helix-turn-helix domain-containing protein n=1 Tax=Pseudidiomarina fusca TaxID=2965078 RepID=A0ABU3KZF4_9GAMM|nr:MULTISPECIES: helix-turn-helix domain-containing protein [Idiomarinaceae]MDT7526878.1 helix-turn-helix domain-containing protein [Pseudidiomarina sp. GXY010]MRJ43224.1 helix-turn-helix domain-containing protein [Idiomarina sp. FeN1]NCU58740.1 helix-turn-helix domain-containing protein [Idiomarina sp. FenA--70]NCU61436.1 helix-turn-helix domain-containing protein [Idiomarina sp. FenBw--71]UUN13512.1 helix-turn-helix domain-containing protein [Idiomarina loihiensis]
MNTYEQLPTAQESALAKLCSQELAAVIETKLDVQSLSLSSPDGQLKQVEIPVSALRLMVNLLTELGEGNTVKLVPIHAELTTQEAADLLNVSRPTVIKLLDDGTVPFHRVGNRRKVRFNDIRQYQNQLEQKRLKALNELSKMDQELGLGY